MAFYTTDILVAGIDELDGGLAVTVYTAHVDKVVQCYLAGELAAWARPEGGAVRFLLPRAAGGDVLFFLAVDPGEERANCWSQAFPTAARYGNRIRIRFRRDLLDGRRPGDLWRAYRGDAADAQATIRLHEAEVYPGGRGATGWGFAWGLGDWGHSGTNAPGWGVHWGSTWGFGIDYLEYICDPLPRGRYPIKVELADAHGNISQAFESAVVLDTFARPARELAVGSYAKAGDTLILTLTPSADIA